MIKLLIGGSPCTHWSIAQKHNRETEPAGLGWELFKNYLIAMEKFKPDFFLYENNKSASPAIKNEISKRLGVDLMYINSSLVSAQNRQRFYAFNWTVEQPSDRGIVLRDILENGTDLMRREKSMGGMVAESFEYIDYSPRDKTHIVINDNAIRCAQDKNGASAAECFVQFTDVKCGTITTAHVPKAIMLATNGEKPIYEIQNGKITIRGKQYPIKLADGYYIIRKLTPIECERLQTLPDNYTAAVSNAQRYRGLGNGWTADVIIHILRGALKNVPRDEEIVVLSMYDGIGTGRYCLDKMGFMNVRYYAYEIDKYAKKIANSNYPDIIQMGDAFDLRNPDWPIGGNTE